MSIKIFPPNGGFFVAEFMPVVAHAYLIYILFYEIKYNCSNAYEIGNYINAYIDDNTLTVNINRLRSKLENIGLNDVIITKRGQGYIKASACLITVGWISTPALLSSRRERLPQTAVEEVQHSF